MPLPELKVPAPLVIRDMNLHFLMTQLPGLSEDRARAEFIRKSLEYGLCGDLEECGLKVRLGEPSPNYSLCLLEFPDEQVREKFGFSQFYVFRGEEAGRPCEVLAFKSFTESLAYFRAEQNS